MRTNNRENIDKSLFNEKSLSLLNIKDLRDVGRKFGIPSPTTMRKKELVDEILKIVYGEVEIPVRKTCGRPSVREFDINKYILKIKNNTDMADEISRMKLDMDYGTMMLSDKSETYGNDEIEIRVFYTDGERCFLRVCEFVESKNDIEISQEFAERFKLENLDVLEILESDRMFKIVSINGVKVKNTFDEIKIAEQIVRKGQSQDFYFRTKEEIDECIENLALQCDSKNAKLLVLSKTLFTGKNVLSLTYSIDEEKSSVYKKVITLVNFCKKEMAKSENIVVVVETPEDVKQAIHGFDEDVKSRMKKYLDEFIVKVLKLGNIFVSLKIEEEMNY